jgi:peptidoglycan lytic transglycosylase D
MRSRTKIAVGVTAALLTGAVVATTGPWRRSISAALRAFHEPELVERPLLPGERRAFESAPRDESNLDRMLADDYIEMSGLDLVLDDEARLSDLRPESLPIPITRRTLRFVKFFTQDPRGRRAFEHLLRRSGRYHGRMTHALRQAHLPDDLVWVAGVESNFDASATSPAGAVGMWQLMPALAKDESLLMTPWLDERRSLDRSTAAAVRHLGKLHEAFGAWDLALAAYNMGQNGLQDVIDRLRALREQRGDAPTRINVAQLAHEGMLPKETADYVPKVVALAVVAANRSRFHFDKVAPDPELAGSTLTVEPETPLAIVAKAANVSVAALRELNPELLEASTPPARPYDVAVPAARLNRTVATLPVYLEEAARQADGLHGLAAAAIVPHGSVPGDGVPGADSRAVPEPPFLLMSAWLDALRVSTELSTPAITSFGLPTHLGHGGGLSGLGGLAWSRGGVDPLRMFAPRAAVSVMPIGKPGTAALAGQPQLERALAFLHDAGTEEALGQGVTLRLEPDMSTARVAITVRLGGSGGNDWRKAPLTDRVVRDTDGEIRFTEIVRPTELDVGLSMAVGRLGLLLAQAAPRSSSAVRARLNRHRRVAVGQLAAGEAWLALGDLMFPPGDPAFGRLLDPRGIDGEWLRDRLLVSETGAERRASRATITVAGHFDAERVRALAGHAVARLGVGVGGRLPTLASPFSVTSHASKGTSDRHRRVEVTSERGRLLVGFRLPGLDEDGFAASLVAMELLAGRNKSVLRRELVDARVIDAYRVDLDHDWHQSVAVLTLTPAEDSDGAQVEEALGSALDAIGRDGPTGVEIAYAQAMVRARLGKRRRALKRRPSATSSLTADRLLESVRPGSLARLHRSVDDTGRRAVERALRAIFVGQPRWVVELVPKSAPGEVAAR